MGILDMLYPQSGGLLNIDPQEQYNYAGLPPGLAQILFGGSMIGPTKKPNRNDTPSDWQEPYGDQSGSTPYTPKPDPYYLSGVIPKQNSVISTETYVPGSAGTPVADWLQKTWGQITNPQFLPSSRDTQPPQQQPTQVPQPPQLPQWGEGATPFQFGGLSGGNAPMAPQPPQRDLAPNGLDRNMTSLPPEYAAMDATRNQLAGYAPSPSVVDQIPANARPTGPAQAFLPQELGIGDRLTAAFQGFTNAGSPMQALGNLVGGITTEQRTDKAGIAQQNTKQAFQGFQQLFLSRGLPPAQANSLAMIAATNPKVAEEILKSPTTMEGAMVNPYVGQGGGNQTKNYLDFIRQKNAAEKAGTTEGEKVATAQLDLPSAVAQANEQLRLLDELKKHPGRSQLGWHDVLGSAPLIPSTKGYDAQVILDQIKGGAFLEAYKTLKGGGQITEVEGKKATAAIARMDRAQSKAEFDKALDDYRGIIKLGIDRANQMAGQPAPGGFQGNTGWTEIKPGIRIRKVQ